MKVTFLDAVKLFYKNYTNFKGCATRAEYWYAVLFILIVNALLGLLATLGEFGIILLSLFALANVIPGLAVCIRRMHDIGKSGWWILITAIPVIGSIWFLVLLLTATKQFDNPYK